MKQHAGGRPSEALLRALGLSPDAGRAEVAQVHTDLTELLRTAPDSLREWAASQQALAQTALAAFGPAAAPTAEAAEAPDAASAAEATPAEAAPAEATPAEAAPAVADDEGADLADIVDEEDLPVAPQQTTTKVARPVTAAHSRRSRSLVWLAGLAAVAALVAGVFYFGDKSQPAAAHQAGAAASATTDADSVNASPTPVPVDPAQVAALEAKIKADPSDTESMHQLAVMYFKANDMDNAAKWDEQILQLKPGDEDAMLELGVTKYNRNDLQGAEDLWLQVVAKNDNNADAHFDLGFLYLNMDPPQMDKCEQHWQRVIDIDPSSDLAQYVSGYMKNHAASDPTPTATPSK